MISDSAITVAARGWRGELKAAPKLLAALGIKFRRKNRETFWLTNEADLEYIYGDLVRRVRQVKAELHPDAGGDAEAFIAFTRTTDELLRMFQKHGVDRHLLEVRPRYVPKKRSELHPQELARVRARGARAAKMYRDKQKLTARLRVLSPRQ